MPILTFNITTINGEDLINPPVERVDVLIVNEKDGTSVISTNPPVIYPLTNVVTVDFTDAEFVAGFNFFMVDQSVPPAWLSTTDYSLDDNGARSSLPAIQQVVVFPITSKLGDNADLPGGADSLSVGSFFVIRGGSVIDLNHDSVSYKAISGDGQYLATVDSTALKTKSGDELTLQPGDKVGLSTAAQVEGVLISGSVKYEQIATTPIVLTSEPGVASQAEAPKCDASTGIGDLSPKQRLVKSHRVGDETTVMRDARDLKIMRDLAREDCLDCDGRDNVVRNAMGFSTRRIHYPDDC